MTKAAGLEAILKRDRRIVGAGLLLIGILAWLYMLRLSNTMDMVMTESMVKGMMKPMIMPWSWADFLSVFWMWAVMMVAMMVPAVAPMVLLYTTLVRRSQSAQSPVLATTLFILGYLLVWWGFALLVTLIQWWLHQQDFLSSMMGSISAQMGSMVLILGGLFQWSPIKHACVNHCRSPFDHITSHWQSGLSGAVRMGASHGLYCLGCCWFLMGLMFVAGVMNLLWMVLIAAYILIEKLMPAGRVGNGFSWLTGFVMVAVGYGMLFI